MKRNIFFFITSIFFSAAAYAASPVIDFVSYENTDYNYKVIVPGKWKKTVTGGKSKHVLQLINGYNSSICIEVLKSSDDIDKIIHEKKWSLMQIDARVHSIIETPTVTLKETASGKFLVFEYFSNRATYLHRTFVSKNGDMVYIINCKAPMWYFSRVEDIFTTALASFAYLSGAEPAEEKKEEKEDDDDDDNEDDDEDE